MTTHSKAPYYQQSTLNGSYSPKILHKIVLPENGFISIFFGVKMFKNAQNVIFNANIGQFWDPMTHSKVPNTTNKVR